MRFHVRAVFGAVAFLSAIAVACGSDSEGDRAGTTEGICAPGSTKFCFGPGACQGGQVCLPDGTGYDSCDCGLDALDGGGLQSTLDASGSRDAADAFSVVDDGPSDPLADRFVSATDSPSTTCTPTLYLMVDQSVSMAETLSGGTTSKWAGMSTGIESWVRSPATAGTFVGMQYFGLQAATGAAECDPSAYELPAIAIDDIGVNGDAMVTSLSLHAPNGVTVLGPALEGATTLARTYARSHDASAIAVVVLTDGVGAYCGGSGALSDVAASSESAFVSDDIRTHIVAFGPGLSSLEQVSMAGGGELFTVETGDVATFVETALLTVRSSLCP